MAIATLAAALPLHLSIGGGGVSGGGVRSSSRWSIGLIARGHAADFGGCTVAYGGCTIALGGIGGSSSIAESLFCSAHSKANLVTLVFSSW